MAAIGGVYLQLSDLRADDRLGELAKYKRITLYCTDAFDVPSSMSLEEVQSIEIGAYETGLIMEDVTYSPWRHLWKGSRLGIAAVHGGATERIAVSNYGGFFKIVGKPGYYQTHGHSRQTLDGFLAELTKHAANGRPAVTTRSGR